MPNSTLTRVRSVRVGHAHDAARLTGVTAIVFDRAAPTVVDVRGGASCTYDTASLSLESTFGRRWAIFFAGGSLFGLDAARGVRTCLLKKGAGHAAFRNPNLVLPISGATLFDLPARRSSLSDYQRIGFRAADRASRDPVEDGRQGAATGAKIGKYLGPETSTPGSLGSAASSTSRGGSVGVLVVLNCVGAIRDPESGEWLEGARAPDGRILPPPAEFRGRMSSPPAKRGTTLVSVVTDVPVDRRTLQRVAIFAHAGLARTVDPVHTATDGDVVFASTTREEESRAAQAIEGELGDTIGNLAARLVVEAARRAVKATPA